MMEAVLSSETSVLTRGARHNIPEDGSLHSHRRENYKAFEIVIDSNGRVGRYKQQD
jgi:hypothetical protein